MDEELEKRLKAIEVKQVETISFLEYLTKLCETIMEDMDERKQKSFKSRIMLDQQKKVLKNLISQHPMLRNNPAMGMIAGMFEDEIKEEPT